MVLCVCERERERESTWLWEGNECDADRTSRPVANEWSGSSHFSSAPTIFFSLDVSSKEDSLSLFSFWPRVCSSACSRATVLSFVSCSSVTQKKPGWTRFYLVLPGFAWSYCVFVGFDMVLPSFTGFYWVFTGFLSSWPNSLSSGFLLIAAFYLVRHGFT